MWDKDGSVTAVRSVEATLSDGGTLFDDAAEHEIAAHWAAELRANPSLFDGRVLIAVAVSVEDGHLRATFRETGFSAFHWWRARSPGRGLRNLFGAAAVRTSDGAVLLGRMAPHTASAGQIYFPCGTPDLDDVFDGTVDLDRSIARELAEETGLSDAVATPTDVRIAVFDRKLCAYVRLYDAALDAAELKARIEDHLASERTPELDAVVLVRSVADLTDASPAYVRLALAHILGR